MILDRPKLLSELNQADIPDFRSRLQHEYEQSTETDLPHMIMVEIAETLGIKAEHRPNGTKSEADNKTSE